MGFKQSSEERKGNTKVYFAPLQTLRLCVKSVSLNFLSIPVFILIFKF
jgi:hypothetical protein